MLEETAASLELFALSPMIAEQTMTRRMQMLTAHPEIAEKLDANDVDISMLSERKLDQLTEGHATVELFSRKGDMVTLSL